ncbi:MAG: hypothetical protein HN353_02965 [Bdellovibrionales bacterium]|nr:hypothetical protein [Bdellovibrionales bacterium]MBT3527133.1 hypothetical protein [Bdellovibrionales bacterium]MBT7669412.1 hypothetical protein [Bdellovibrionales bacterium]MBT7767065.1 hypothetical protein [Bdellovibrionales bacterium]
MRLRTWHPYWQGLLCKQHLPWILSYLLIASNALGSVNDGVFGSLERLIQLDRNNIHTLKERVRRDSSIITTLSQATKISLQPQFMQSILLYTNPDYMHLININPQRKKCIFYSLLENRMLNYVDGVVNDVIVQYHIADGEKREAIMDIAEFLNIIYKKECSTNRTNQESFADDKIIKTIAKTKFPIPRTAGQCQKNYSDWISNPFIVQLCKVPHTIQSATKGTFDLNNPNNEIKEISKLLSRKINHPQADLYRTKIPFFNLSYLFNLCQNISNPKKFCYNYTKNTIWLDVTEGKYPKYVISHRCREMTRKKRLGAITLKACASTLNRDNTICLKPNKEYPSLLRTSNCSEVSNILEHANLKTDYHDCPGKIDNDGVTNIHRILMHLHSSSYQSSSLTCNSEANYSFFKLNQQFDNINNWPLQICYLDPVTEMKRCLKYFSGNLDQNSPHSESKVVGQVLHNIRGAPNGLSCRIVDKKNYNPNRLEHQNGCTIVYDTKNCSITKCQKMVIYRKHVVKDISYEGSPKFYYFPSSYSNNQFSVDNMMKETQKIRQKKIYNQTMLQRFIDYRKGNIVHGIGCSEDLHPMFFQRKTLNGCRPIPFIIDGYIDNSGDIKIILRTSISDIHNPLLITWNRIFSSLAHYQATHPLKIWSLFGISKASKK